MNRKRAVLRMLFMLWMILMLTFAGYGCGKDEGPASDAGLAPNSETQTPTLKTKASDGSVVHVDNPYEGALSYVNPDWSAKAAAEPGGDRISNISTGVWLDRIAAIEGTAGVSMGLREHLDAALVQSGGDPIVAQFVIYNLPGRDCSALASNGELGPDELPRYKTEYIDPIAKIMADAKYSSVRIVTVIEIDSLPNLITNENVELCREVKENGAYENGVAYALEKLHAIPNVYTYVDAAHHGWLGWDSNFVPAAQLLASTARLTSSGTASVDGFITNTANYSALVEPYITINNETRQTDWVDWNYYVDELSYAKAFRQELINQGFSSHIGMLIDTSRNGWGGPDRPTGPSSSTDINTYVEESRIDRRIHAGNWCNQAGAGLGERPTANPEAGIDAYVWIKPPGESDGSSSYIPNDEGKGFDGMCDPTYTGNERNGNSMSGAKAGAPISGAWFSDQFQELMANAWPPLDGSVSTGDSDDNSDSSNGTDITDDTDDSDSSGTPNDSTDTDNSSDGSNGSNSTTEDCHVDYVIQSDWGSGFTAQVTMTNKTGQAINNWKLAWSFANGERVTNPWNASVIQSGNSVTATDAGWNANISAHGGTAGFGFQGTYSGVNAIPSEFTLNGVTCNCNNATSDITDDSDNTDDSGTTDDSDTTDDTDTTLDPGTTFVGQHGQLQLVGTQLADQDGNPVQLKGMSTHWVAWYPDFVNEDAIAWLIENKGMTLFRVAMGVEPDGHYLDKPEYNMNIVKKAVDACLKLGIYVIIDWHDHNAANHEAEAIDFFKQMAVLYGDSPNVLYEVFNEPLQVSWADTVKPYAQRVANAIRTIDPDNMILVGTPQWDQKPEDAANDPLTGFNIMYTLHFYSGTHGKWLRDTADAAMGKGAPLFVSEWGATNADGGADGSIYLDEAQHWIDWMNERKLSWAAWNLADKYESTSIIKEGHSPTGPWTDDDFKGHGPFVLSNMAQ